MPSRPPIKNMAMKPRAKSIGTFKLILPKVIVASQLKIFTAVGMAISVVLVAKKACAIGGKPTANIWCAHTVKLKKPMATPDQATKVYPKIGLREKTGNTSEIIPKTGKIKMYTSGWPKDQ